MPRSSVDWEEIATRPFERREGEGWKEAGRMCMESPRTRREEEVRSVSGVVRR